MADNNKIEAGFLDIPDGQGGTQRTWFKDVEARAGNPTYASTTTCEDIIDELV